jgi:hypothetical protein
MPKVVKVEWESVDHQSRPHVGALSNGEAAATFSVDFSFETTLRSSCFQSFRSEPPNLQVCSCQLCISSLVRLWPYPTYSTLRHESACMLFLFVWIFVILALLWLRHPRVQLQGPAFGFSFQGQLSLWGNTSFRVEEELPKSWGCWRVGDEEFLRHCCMNYLALFFVSLSRSSLHSHTLCLNTLSSQLQWNRLQDHPLHTQIIPRPLCTRVH